MYRITGYRRENRRSFMLGGDRWRRLLGNVVVRKMDILHPCCVCGGKKTHVEQLNAHGIALNDENHQNNSITPAWRVTLFGRGFRMSGQFLTGDMEGADQHARRNERMDRQPVGAEAQTRPVVVTNRRDRGGQHPKDHKLQAWANGRKQRQVT